MQHSDGKHILYGSTAEESRVCYGDNVNVGHISVKLPLTDNDILEIGHIYELLKSKKDKAEESLDGKIKTAIKEEFLYRASQGRTNYSVEELLFIVNEVIDEVVKGVS